MGRDGAAGLLKLRQAGWHTIAQDEADLRRLGDAPRGRRGRRRRRRSCPSTEIAAAIVEHAGRAIERPIGITGARAAMSGTETRH